MSKLNDIALFYGTDKSSDFHNYCEKYEKYLPFKCNSKLKILEIGVLKGESLKTWKDYYPNAFIVGIDINPECIECAEERIAIETGSQTDAKFLFGVIKKHGPFDLIIDDGSHVNSDIIFSFKYLFKSLRPGGIYVVEDCGTSYWKKYGGALKSATSTMEYFKSLTDDINFRGLLNSLSTRKYSRREDQLLEISKRTQPDCRTDIESVIFLNGLIIITKR